MTSYPHIAGEEGDLRSADYVYDNWVSQGLDYVKKLSYDVFLSYPNKNKPNRYHVHFNLIQNSSLID